MADRGIVEGKYHALASRFDEATLRLWAAVEARTLGRGGVSVVAKAVGFSRTTIYAGLEELKSTPASKAMKATPPVGATARRVRAQGGGRKRLTYKDASLLARLGCSGRAYGAGRSAIAAAVDMQEYPAVGSGVSRTGSPLESAKRLRSSCTT